MTTSGTGGTTLQTVNLSSFGGIDSSTLINNLVALANVPIQNLQSQQAALQSKQSLFDNLASLASTLATTASGLSTSTSVQSYAVGSSDATKATATATVGAKALNHTLSIDWLAQPSVFAGQGYASDTATGFGTGSLSVTVGTKSTPVTIKPGKDSLQGIADAVNGANLGVQASIVNDGSSKPYRLVITGTATGGANAVSLDTSGLSGGTQAAFSWTPISAAKDASFTLDGIPLQRPTNTVTDALAGVTLNLVSPTAKDTSITLGVAVDTGGISAKVQGLVNAYNGIVQAIGASSHAPVGASVGGKSTQAAGALLGDPFADLGTSMLQRAVDTATGPAGAPNLAVVGITTQKDGTLAINSSMLDSALASDPQSVSQLIANAATKLSMTATNLSSPGSGVFASRSKELGTEIGQIDTQITVQQAQVSHYQDQLTLQFSQLNSLMASFNSQSNFLNQAFSTSSTKK